MTIEERILQAKTSLSKNNRFPFFGYLLFLLIGRECDENVIPTAGVGRDAQYLYYNPKFIDTLKPQELQAVMVHEVMHLALQHIWRGDGKDPMLWNFAADICINNDINGYQGMKLPKGTLLDHKYKGWFTEQIYYDLKSKIEKALEGNGKINMGFADGNGGESRKDVTVEETESKCGAGQSHKKWKDGKGSKKDKDRQKKWQRAVDQAAEIHAKKQGNLPGELQRIVEEARPKMDWREILISYIVKCHDDYTYSPSDRRFLSSDFIMPSMDEGEKIDEVVISIDTSGSMTNEQLNTFAGEVKGLIGSFKNIKAYVCSIDTKVYDFKEIDDYRVEVKYFGGGGTDYNCIFDEIKKRNINPVVLIIMGDCYASFPATQPEGYDTIFLVTRDHQVPPFGRMIPYE